MGDQNKVFSLKQGFGIVTNVNVLWVQVLRAKWSIGIAGIKWSIGSGRLVNLWNDSWLDDVGPLKQFYTVVLL